MNRRRRWTRGGTGSTTVKTEETGGPRRAESAESLGATVPLVYDAYYGDFVPVEHASFDVSTTPDAVVRRAACADGSTVSERAWARCCAS